MGGCGQCGFLEETFWVDVSHPYFPARGGWGWGRPHHGELEGSCFAVRRLLPGSWATCESCLCPEEPRGLQPGFGAAPGPSPLTVSLSASTAILGAELEWPGRDGPHGNSHGDQPWAAVEGPLAPPERPGGGLVLGSGRPAVGSCGRPPDALQRGRVGTWCWSLGASRVGGRGLGWGLGGQAEFSSLLTKSLGPTSAWGSRAAQAAPGGSSDIVSHSPEGGARLGRGCSPAEPGEGPDHVVNLAAHADATELLTASTQAAP